MQVADHAGTGQVGDGHPLLCIEGGQLGVPVVLPPGVGESRPYVAPDPRQVRSVRRRKETEKRRHHENPHPEALHTILLHAGSYCGILSRSPSFNADRWATIPGMVMASDS